MKLDDGRAPDGLKHVVKFHWVYFKGSRRRKGVPISRAPLNLEGSLMNVDLRGLFKSHTGPIARRRVQVVKGRLFQVWGAPVGAQEFRVGGINAH